MPKNNVDAITANLKTIGANKNTKIDLNNSIVDYSNLSDALSGKKIKGNVEIDLEGDGIFDKKIKAKNLNKTYKNNSEVLDKVKDEKINSNNADAKTDELTNDELLLNFTKGKTHREAKHGKNDILNYAEKSGINPTKLGKTVGDKINALTEKHEDFTNKAFENDDSSSAKGAIYTVQNGDTVKTIAAKLYEDKDKQNEFIKKLRSANPDEVRTYANNKNGRKKIEGFQVGHTIYLPEVSKETMDKAFGKDLKSSTDAEKDYKQTVDDMKKKGETVRNKEIDKPAGGDAKFTDKEGNEVDLTSTTKDNSKTYTETVKDSKGKTIQKATYDENGIPKFENFDGNKTVNNENVKVITNGNERKEYHYNKDKNSKYMLKYNGNQLKQMTAYYPNGAVKELNFANSEHDLTISRFFTPDGNIIISKKLGDNKFELFTFDKNHKQTSAQVYNNSSEFRAKLTSLGYIL